MAEPSPGRETDRKALPAGWPIGLFCRRGRQAVRLSTDDPTPGRIGSLRSRDFGAGTRKQRGIASDCGDL